ncbi:Fertility inhibition FinO-like protein [Candidatus Falkowbacteria bacterium]|nr:Fertility inhibition FinO-like protein [Candidatus Falkowbacteria bacterium]
MSTNTLATNDAPQPRVSVWSSLSIADLYARFPACFNASNPRPLKVRIHKDLAHALWVEFVANRVEPEPRMASRILLRQRVRRLLNRYCGRPAYLQVMLENAVRIDLEGAPAGKVSKQDADYASARLAVEPPAQKPQVTAPATRAPHLPNDAPLTEDNIVPGRLELTVKFTQLPKPVELKSGMKIGIQAEKNLVITTLPPKTWKKLIKAASDWPEWVAAMTGKLGAQVTTDMGTAILLEEPNLQVFEKKPKPTIPVAPA